MKRQTKYYLIGSAFLIMAMFCITFLPPLIKFKTTFHIKEYIYVQLEFFLLLISSIFYLFSPKYYIQQIEIIILAILYYLYFIKFYPLFF